MALSSSQLAGGVAPSIAPRKSPQRAGETACAPAHISRSSDAAEGEPRLARPSDIANAPGVSKGAKRYWISHLCKYRNTSNLAWPKMATAMADLVASERSIQNYRSELLKAGYICLPEGDAGGRPADGTSRGLAIHLHPDGKPCNLPHVVLKQRNGKRQANKGADSAPFVEADAGEKDAELAPLRVQKRTEKGAENDTAIRKEPLIELFIKEPSTTTISTPVRETVAPIQLGGDGVADPPADKSLKSAIFDDLQQMCDPPAAINAVGRHRILRAAESYGFSLAELLYAWRHDSRAQTGGLISLAEHWADETAHLQFPSCLLCEDTGIPVRKQKLALNSRQPMRAAAWAAVAQWGTKPNFCHCRLGSQAALATARSQLPELASQFNTTREEQRNQKPAKAIEWQRRWQEEAAEKECSEARRIAKLQADHICPTCEGRGGREQCGSWHLCIGCLGTGQYFTVAERRNRGECEACRGAGRILDPRQVYNRTSKRAPRMVPCTTCGGLKEFVSLKYDRRARATEP